MDGRMNGGGGGLEDQAVSKDANACISNSSVDTCARADPSEETDTFIESV